MIIFEIEHLSTVDYYNMPCSPEVQNFILKHSTATQMNGQALRVEAKRVRKCVEPIYSSELFPDGTPVQLVGALEKWVNNAALSKRSGAPNEIN